MLGGKHVMVETFKPVGILKYIEAERVIQFNAVPLWSGCWSTNLESRATIC